MELKYNKDIEFKNYDQMYAEIIKMYAIEKDPDKKENIKKVLDQLNEKRKEERYKRKIEYWENLNKKFDDILDVPPLNLRGEDHEKYVIPALIRNGAIPKKDLKDGHFYYGEWRRGNFAVWDKGENTFKIWRNKWNKWYLDKGNHFEDDNNFALFIPIKEITEDQFNNREI